MPRRRKKRHAKPIAVDLFAGCGALSLGLARGGFRVAAAVEVAGNLDCAWATPAVTAGAAAAVTTAVTVRSRSRLSTDASGSRSIWTSFLHLAGLRPGASISPQVGNLDTIRRPHSVQVARGPLGSARIPATVSANRARCGDAARGVVRRCMASDPVSHRLAEGRSVSALTADCRCRGKASARTLSQNQFEPCRIAAGRGKAVCRPRLDRSDSRGLALMAKRVVDLRLR